MDEVSSLMLWTSEVPIHLKLLANAKVRLDDSHEQGTWLQDTNKDLVIEFTLGSIDDRTKLRRYRKLPRVSAWQIYSIDNSVVLKNYLEFLFLLRTPGPMVFDTREHRCFAHVSAYREDCIVLQDDNTVRFNDIPAHGHWSWQEPTLTILFHHHGDESKMVMHIYELLASTNAYKLKERFGRSNDPARLNFLIPESDELCL